MGAQYNSRNPAPGGNGNRKRAASDYDPLLPVQYYQSVGQRRPSGELKLSFAILEDALRCYARTKNCRSGAKRAEFVDAREWFHARGTPHVFSFESVCAFLDIDPNWLRKKLESLSPADFPLKQFRTRRRAIARPSANSTPRPRAQQTPARADDPQSNGIDAATSPATSEVRGEDEVYLIVEVSLPLIEAGLHAMLSAQDEKRPG